MTKHKVFVAINLPAEIRKELYSYAEKWPELPARWTPKDNLHITLEFLGGLTDEEIGEVCLAAKGTAEKHKSFSISISQILYGPPKKMPPRIVWAEGEKSKELSLLREDLENALTEKVRFAPENRMFAPHITLARISEWEFKKIEPEERPEVNEMIDLMFTVESIEVMESEMKREGPVYTILESYNLGE